MILDKIKSIKLTITNEDTRTGYHLNVNDGIKYFNWYERFWERDDFNDKCAAQDLAEKVCSWCCGKTSIARDLYFTEYNEIRSMIYKLIKEQRLEQSIKGDFV